MDDLAPPRGPGLAALNAPMRVFGIVSRASPAVVDELVWHVSGWDMVAARCACVPDLRLSDGTREREIEPFVVRLEASGNKGNAASFVL